MKLDQLLYFLEAAKSEHVGRAAKILSISPSAISHSISSLEEELGRDLFVRQGKKIFLTSHGKLLMEKAQSLLSDVELIREEIGSDRMELRGHYKIAATHFLCSQYLTPAWASVSNNSPKLSSEIYTLRSAEVVSGVASGEFDLGLCFNPQSHPELRSTVLRTGLLQIVVAKNHPLLKKRGADRFSALSHYPAVLPKSFQGVDVCERHPVFEKFSITVRADCLVDSYEVALKKVGSSLSWGFVPDWVIARHTSDVRALTPPKGWDAPYHVVIIWSKNRLLSEVLRKLIHAVREKIHVLN